ncbi:hypothetical protein E0L36_20715 [Streptomyces sp. AJS327]|uniref:aspartate/glutamate racemase family protein n=1 Tax=Streptomyces sp. AJS327 TaxID=2545265 RepID=UPI0015DDE3A3|nr:aspartate/glutamate racemase family protein [Streptomyces sp. AJS327]MBA0053207.1 hypothetical protein [Streptomyces sp. AJS327]
MHTVPALAPVFEDLAASSLPGVATRHLVDEDLLSTATAVPGLDFDRTVTRLQHHVDTALDEGASAVVVTCSTMGPATDVVAATRDVPVIRIDRPMARQAVRHRRVGVIATLESNRAASRAVIEDTATAEGRTVQVEDRLCADAFDLLRAGDQAGHDQAIREAAATLAPSVDVLVLAQASMAGAAIELDLDVPVLTSPAATVAEAGTALGQPRAGARPPRGTAVSQLRIYRIRPGLMDAWLPFFHRTLVPLHHLVGITVPAAWTNPHDAEEFVWIRQFESLDTVTAQEEEFFSTPARVALGDVRGRYVASHEVRLLHPSPPTIP